MNGKYVAYCIQCRSEREYKIKTRRVKTEVRGTSFDYVEWYAICTDCGEELYIPEINDHNVDEAENAYRKAAGLITVSEIRGITEKYNIAVKPLSKLMGFGEITISRYVSGQLPSKSHSDQLLEVYASHKAFEEKLKINGNVLTPIAFQKCNEAISKLNNLYSGEKIDLVARYLLSKANDITHMALQKLLYYSQAFFEAIFNTVLFEDACQAWAKGPVYPSIYYKYCEYGFNPIDRPLQSQKDDENGLTNREIDFLNSIISAFGCYSGDMLSRITHAELPWIEARGDLLPADRSVTELDKELIRKYFKEIVEKYHIVNPCDMKKYSVNMGKQILH